MIAKARLTQAERDVAAELLSIDTAINCYEDAHTIIDTIHTLTTQHGETGLSIIRWLTLLPRARNRNNPPLDNHNQPVQLTLLTPLAQKTRMPAVHTLRYPDTPKTKPGPRAEREAKRRPARAHCIHCGAEFEMNRAGRPAVSCPEHRQRQRKRKTA